MKYQSRNTSFGTLIALSLLGVGSILFSSFPILKEFNIPKWTILIQPLLLTVGFVFVGLYALRKTNFPFQFKSYTELLEINRKGVLAGIVVALFLGILLLFIAPYLEALLPSYLGEFDIALATKLLYGGINEEIIMRLGVLSLAFYISIRFFGHHSSQILAIVLSSLLFALGHMPILFADGSPGLEAVSFVVGANFLFGIVFGYLYVKFNLMTSMICHAATHLFHSILTLTLM